MAHLLKWKAFLLIKFRKKIFLNCTRTMDCIIIIYRQWQITLQFNPVSSKLLSVVVNRCNYYIAMNIKWLKVCDKSQGTNDIGTLTWYRHAYSDAFACCRCMTLLLMTLNVHDVARKISIRLCRIWILCYKISPLRLQTTANGTKYL